MNEMNKCFLLMKIQFLGLFDINRAIHSKDKKEKRRLILMGAIMLFVLVLMVSSSAGIAFAAAYLDMAEVLPPLILMACTSATLVVSFFKSNGILFGFKDYDTVMSLPVKHSSVVLSRLLSVYSMNLLISSVIMLPSIIVYGVTYSVSSPIWCMLILSLFIASLLPMILAMLIGVVITAVAVRFRYKNLFIIVLSTAAVLALLSVMFMIPDDEAVITEMVSSATQGLYKIYPVAELYTNALMNNDWGSFVLFALISLGVSFIFVIILSAFYHKINTALFAVHSKNNYKITTLKASSPFMALYKKELKRLISSPIYALNTCMGAILLIALSVAYLFIDIEQIAVMMVLSEETNILSSMKSELPWIITVIISLPTSTTGALSLEGKSRWIMCSVPVDSKTVFNSKIAVSLTYMIPSTLVSCTLFTIDLKPNFIETLALFLIPLFFSVLISVLGLAFNYKYPKYDWTTEMQAVKNTTSVIAALGVGVGSVFALYILSLLLRNMPIVHVLFTIIVISFATIIVYKKLTVQKLYV